MKKKILMHYFTPVDFLSENLKIYGLKTQNKSLTNQNINYLLYYLFVKIRFSIFYKFNPII